MKAFGKGAVAAIAALALAMTGCQGKTDAKSKASGMTSKSAQAQYNPQPRENLQDGGTLTTALLEIPEQLNAWQSNMNAYTRQIWGWYNPRLTYYTPEGELQIDQNYLVEMPKVSKDGDAFKVIYTLNPKATYNDGDPIDWKSFEAAWKACGEVTADQYDCNSTDGYKEIKSVTQGKDAKEVIVEFKAPYAWYGGMFDMLLNPKALDPKVFTEGYLNGQAHPEWGAGPFKLETLDMDQKIVTFVRNEKWWGDAPKLEKRTFRVMDSQASLNAFKNNEIDYTGAGTANRLAQIKNMQNIVIERGASTSSNLMTLNAASDKLRDVKVREAIFRGVNRKALAKMDFEGLDYTEDLPGSFLLFAFQKGYQDNFGSLIQFTPEKSKQLLDEAGWKAGADGIREKDGVKLSLVFPVFGDDPVQKTVVQALQGMMKDIGVDVVYDQHPNTDFSKVMKARSFDFLSSGFRSSDPYGVAGICQVYCSDSTLNKSKTADPAYDQTIKDLQKIEDLDKQIAEANKVEQKAMSQFGIMPMSNGPTIVAKKKGLANYGASVFFSAPPQNIGWEK